MIYLSPPDRESVAVLPKDGASASWTSLATLRAGLGRRPRELSLTSSAQLETPRLKSELEMQHDLVRSSQTRSKASLKSPGQLLKDRLNLTPVSASMVRTFSPPKPMFNGCLLPGVEAKGQGFLAGDVRARSGKGHPAWWCKLDKVVVLENITLSDDGEALFHTRSSKGLSIARRKGVLETIIIPLDCTHCQGLLKRREWKLQMHMCKHSVCWDCKERCLWEMEQAKERNVLETKQAKIENHSQADQMSADSVLEDGGSQDGDLMREIGIALEPNCHTEVIDSIEERLEETSG